MSLDQLIADWKEGKDVRVLRIGHGDAVRQSHAYAYAFDLAERFTRLSDHSKESFDKLCQTLRSPRLSGNEHTAAESMAWVAVTRGLESAFANFPESQFISLRREVAP